MFFIFCCHFWSEKTIKMKRMMPKLCRSSRSSKLNFIVLFFCFFYWHLQTRFKVYKHKSNGKTSDLENLLIRRNDTKITSTKCCMFLLFLKTSSDKKERRFWWCFLLSKMGQRSGVRETPMIFYTTETEFCKENIKNSYYKFVILCKS